MKEFVNDAPKDPKLVQGILQEFVMSMRLNQQLEQDNMK